ncbi:hypothetical protein QQ054_16085 [Oscillatoria amoena NRMC-F 0135]|nr:hypothetical protein [Oscillatoria laete-virens]MDL5047536.1 hypothetical protein [Oscillatoria amoena NRMC-F 0135]MDL5054642.1 hypothetical protein [Oscillatoria laete-virens NRMC-F 0139]
MSEIPPLPPQAAPKKKKAKGYLDPKLVRGIAFYVISGCVIFSILVSILRIWDFTKGDVLWRLIATFVVVGVGMAIFTFVNEVFAPRDEDQ